MEKQYEQASLPLSNKKIMFNNFIGGLFWALGATVGLSIIVAILTILAHIINVVPIIGSFVSEIINFVLLHNPNLQR